MKVAVTGSSGLIGSALIPRLEAAGHSVLRLVRGPAAPEPSVPGTPEAIRWDPQSGVLDAGLLAGVSAAVHLAGEGIAEKRWTPAQKQRILASRVESTRLLAAKLAELEPTPKVLVSGSAVGFYGDRGDEVLTEESSGGTGFLADLVAQWEAATRAAELAGIRVVHIRTGIVLSPAGGALKRQLPLFKVGLGGRLGSGRQYQSWISIADE
ncbi:MAG TPA: TIGR01777 family oxidoreductase, partial [Acidimicrobiales bacterium]|nr:TIGR01777 family oxidoreductase [Acidimicrobiales bacterium]